MQTTSKWTWWWRLAVVSLGALLYSRGLHWDGQPGVVPQDFGVYHLAVEREFVLGENPYRHWEPLPFKYAPAALVGFAALPRDAETAWKLFKALLLTVWIAAVGWGMSPRGARGLALGVVGVALGWKGLLETLSFGQIETLLLASGVAAFALVARGHWRAAGALLALLPAFKPTWGLIGLPIVALALLPGGRPIGVSAGARLVRLVGAGALSVGIWGVVIPLAALGWDKTWLYYHYHLAVIRLQPAHLYWNDFNQSWLGALNRALGEGETHLGAVLLTALLALASARALLKRLPLAAWQSEPLLAATPWLLWSQLANPVGWRWGSLLLVGIPLALERARLTRKTAHERRLMMLACGAGGVLFLLQIGSVARFMGLEDWTILHRYSTVCALWSVALLIGILSLPTPPQRSAI